MAKIEHVPASPSAKSGSSNSKKRKLKDGAERSSEADSPTSKFKKLDISQIGKRHPQPQQPVVSPPQLTVTVASSPAAAEDKPNSKGASKKRKQQSTTADSTKVAKKTKTSVNTRDDEDNEDADADAHEPTAAELCQADRPENVPQIETTRAKKRVKHAKVQQTAKVDSVQREELRNREYLEQWRDDRSAWKFNKLRQISLTKALFREVDPLDDELWQLAMDYLCGAKGNLRQLMRDAAQKVIDDIDRTIGADDGRTAELVKSVNYTRARTFMQMLE